VSVTSPFTSFTIQPAVLEDIAALKHIRDNVTENALVTLRIEHADYVRAFTEEGRAWTCVVDGAPVGFVCVRPGHRDVWALFVRADHEGRGIGDALMDVAEQWMFAHPARIDEMHLSTEQGTRAERLYARRGWQRQGVVRGEVVYTLPRRISLRRADVDDARAIGALHVASWQWAYRGSIDQAYLDALDPIARAERWRELLSARAPHDPAQARTWLAFDGAELVGFVDTARSDDDAAAFEVRALYVAAHAAGTGVGAQLLRRALRDVERHGARGVFLWVLAANTRARRFYEKHGFKPDGAFKVDVRTTPTSPAPPLELFEVRYARRA
jgi:GNAT superfamily N-acetyltransferase